MTANITTADLLSIAREYNVPVTQTAIAADGETLVRYSWGVETYPSPEEAVEAIRAYKAERFGDLHDYTTGAYIRPATREERDESREAGAEGVISVAGRSCYVEE